MADLGTRLALLYGGEGRMTAGHVHGHYQVCLEHDEFAVRAFELDAVDYLVERLTLEALSALATRLEPVGFMRVHRGELINVARAVRVEDGQHVAELDDGQAARVSRRLLAAFKAALRVS
jgi:DNA-binding LytR/AlgR family response regulator